MNTKMKVLSLALIGAFGYVGAATAGGTCPSSPSPPWTSAFALGGTLQIVEGGYAGTACRLDSALTGDGSSFATVSDETPNAEGRYRAQFIINADNLTNLGLVDAAYVFSATGGSGSVVQISVVGDGAGGRIASFIVLGGAAVQSVPLAAGENRIEFDFNGGGSEFKAWVNNNDEGNPDYQTAITSGGATVDTAFLGLAGATSGFLSAFNGTTVGFDQFDSRRQTFIGF